MDFSSSAFYNPVSARNRQNCSQKAFYIKKQGLHSTLLQVHYIFSVQPRLIRYFQFITSVDLRPSCQPRQDTVRSIFITFPNQIFLIPQRRSWTDNTHLSPKDIPNLRELIQTRLPEHAPDSCYILLRILQLMCWHIRWGAHLHTAVFMQHKKDLALPHSFLCKKHRPRIVQINCKTDQTV